MPGSSVSFTLIKKGRKLVKVVNLRISGFSLRFSAFLSQHGRKATGDARVRWEQGGVPCGGVPETWTSRAVKAAKAGGQG